MGGVSSVGRVDGLLGPDVAEDFLTVAEELVEEESVSDEHGEDDHEEVEELAESEVEVIASESWLELDEVVGDGLGLSVAHDVLQHAALQEASPQGARHLGEPEAEGE